jgi:site-specific DNA-methyltransferase (adenine-specific)
MGQAGRFQLGQSDAVAWLRGLPSASVDLVVTDPPYESLEKHRAVGTTTRLKHSKASSNDWFEIFPNARFEELFTEIYRVLRRNTHFYLFCDAETMFVAKPIGEQVGFKFWKPIIWDKKKIGMGYHYRARYECILFFEKGKRKLSDLGVADIIEAPRILHGYPTEKPRAVSEVLVRQSTEPGELVVDPFMGAGSVGLAAVSQARDFTGNDLCAEAVEITRRRLLEAGATTAEVISPARPTESQLGLAI